MKRMIDPLDVSGYDSIITNTTASGAVPSLLVKGSRVRVGLVFCAANVTFQSALDTATLMVKRGLEFLALAAVGAGHPVAVLRLEDYGPIIFEDLYTASPANDINVTLVETVLSHRGV